MPPHDESRLKPDGSETAEASYEKPAILWEQSIDVRRLSVGCTRQEQLLVCQSLGEPFGS